MSIKLTGKNALITGAARGLGLAIADNLASRGVNVCGTDLRLDLLETEFGRIAKEHNVKTRVIAGDVSNEKDVKDTVRTLISEWSRIDVLVNNAGLRKIAPVQALSVETWRDVLDTNLKGQFLYTREVLAQGMLAENEGVIIFLSSDAGKKGQASGSAYAASKFGIFGLAESVASDLKNTKIRVTTIAPGRIWTPMAEESEAADMDLDWLDATDVARAVSFCIAQDADTIIPELRIYHRSQI